MSWHKSLANKVIDRLLTSLTVREKLWLAARDLFTQASPANICKIPLAPLPEKYNRHEPTISPEEKKRPIFITARFRSGSTFLWQLFRAIPDTTSYYEPLNESRWFILNKDNHSIDQTHLGAVDYRAEYEGMHDLDALFSMDWHQRWLYMDERYYDPALYRYISELISRAKGQPVLQFNRMDFRLAWLKANFPDAVILHLYRNPREQWMSIIRKGSHITLDRKISSAYEENLDSFYTLSWTRDLRHVFPFLEPVGQHPYALHYYLWRLSYSFGQHYADYSICYEVLISNFESESSALFDFLGWHEVNIESLTQLNRGKITYQSRNYAPESWYQEIESECDRNLDAFFQSSHLPLK